MGISTFRRIIVAVGLSWMSWAMTTATVWSQSLYSFGNPTAEEQYYVELINRARSNPPAEGGRLASTTDPDVNSACNYFGVDRVMLQNEFNAIAAQAPLAPNASLTSAARGHSNWMLANATQSHEETNPSNTTDSRITAAGYDYSTAAENIYASAKSVWYGHAGFQVDWGSGTGGMQNPRGHRDNIHSADFREIGVGVTLGSNGGVGPQLVTQDFGTRQLSPTFGTGVAYYDLNANNFYDIGEGISGLTVNVSGASYYCTTAIGGGWVVPVPDAGATRTVTFSGLNVNQSVNLAFPAYTNAKADLKLTYSPPSFTSASTTTSGDPFIVNFTAVGGATQYLWNRWNMGAVSPENCENTANITSTTTGTYPVLNTTVKQQGTASFHLENSTGSNQSIQLNSLFYGQTSPTITFQSRVRVAATSEIFKVQVKDEGSNDWRDVYSQAGSGGSGETGFNTRTASLTGTSGKAFRVRFLLNFNGSYYPASGDSYGWFIDAISFSGVSTLQNNASQNLSGTSGTFTPDAGTYLMSLSPVISGRSFPASYQTLTVSTGTITTPMINTQPASVTIGTGGTATFNVVASGGSLGYQWYAGNSGVTTNPVSGANGSSFTTPVLTTTSSYWVRVSNSAGAVNSNTASATVLTPPNIASQPVSTTVISGNTATFSVTATGTSPAYQWYLGSSGNTSSPIAGATGSSFTTPALTTTNSYWVRISNAVGNSDSTTATATVVSTPSITSQPASVTINSGSTATFTVTASGGSLVYQWYAGSSGNTSNPVPGANGGSFTTGTLTANSSYWVRVSNAAGSANSTSATATVIVAPIILSQPVSPLIRKSTTATLKVIASGSNPTYQWYAGSSGTTTSPVSGATGSTFTTPQLTRATSYWVRVSNTAGSVNSVTANVSVSNNSVTRTFSTWATEIENANSITAGTLGAQPNGDYDKDGRSNLIEYAFGASPIVTNDPAPRMPVMQMTATDLVLTYQRDTALTDITLTAQACGVIGSWKAPGESGAPAGFSDTFTTSGGIETHQAKIPRGSGGRFFMRIRVTQP